MRSVIEACLPRPEIISGTFNPEVFTAALGPVLTAYRTGAATIDNVYTDAISFFRDATYPTEGMRSTLTEVFQRIAGDPATPAIHRLETAFGGGKTHTLIACTHIAYRGRTLAGYTDELLPVDLLPLPGTVSVVGIAGDELAVHKTEGEALRPYTLWGEIAYQTGGEELYRRIGSAATSLAAPGAYYYEQVLGNRKVLLMLDELAQYAARLEAAHPNGAQQLAAFLMGLHTYVRNHTGISVVLTLAGATDAFARQTEELSHLLSDVRGTEVSARDALVLTERAVRDVGSVIARDASQVTPVQAAELSAVLAKRLFTAIDQTAAEQTAEEYRELYQRNLALLPESAQREDYRQRMVHTYPFHPTLIDFLNQKLATAENFQGTRGVLRLLALAVRQIWQSDQDIPLIHASHLDLRSVRVVNEVLNRTNSADLLPVLNADIGGVDTERLQGGKSNAELVDEQNPHPFGYPFCRYTWQTVFLHSLVGRSQGLASALFGISQSECMLAVAMPNLPPAQVDTALKEIASKAFYLRVEQGRYFAATEPTINSVLARIRQTVNSEQIKGKIRAKAQATIATNQSIFQIVHDVQQPEDIPDRAEKPSLAVVSAWLTQVDVEALIKTKGENQARRFQNMVLVLVPSFVEVTNRQPLQLGLAMGVSESGRREQQELLDSARHAVAIELLRNKPEAYGVRRSQLDTKETKDLFSAAELEFSNRVARAYNRLYYPAISGQIVSREIAGADVERGTTIIQDILNKLRAANEMLTSDSIKNDVLGQLVTLFLSNQDTLSLQQLKNNFGELRHWPLLENAEVLVTILRLGVERAFWCVYRMGDAQSVTPIEIYDQEHPLPLATTWLHEGFSLISLAGAKQRGWVGATGPKAEDVAHAIYQQVQQQGQISISEAQGQAVEHYGDAVQQIWPNSVAQITQAGDILVARCSTPDGQLTLLSDYDRRVYQPRSDDQLLTPARAAELGLLQPDIKGVRIASREAAGKFHNLMSRLGSIYQRGACSVIDDLELSQLAVSDQGNVSISLQDIQPEAMDQVGELLAMLASISKVTPETELRLAINHPKDKDPWWANLEQK